MSYHPNSLGFAIPTSVVATVKASPEAVAAAAAAKRQADIVAAGKLAAVSLAQPTGPVGYPASGLPGWLVPVGILAAVGLGAFFFLRK